jgi:sugar phosphate isomerase/epimerase
MTHERDILKRCGVSQIVTPAQSVADDCDLYAAAGFGAIGIWLHKLERGRIDGFWIPEARITDEMVAAAVDAVRGSGLEVSHLVLTGFYTMPDVESRITHTLHAMEVAAALGAATVVVAPGRREGLTYEQTRDHVARALSTVFERSTSGMRLAIEPIVPWQSDYMNTLAEALELVDLVGHPDLGVYPDTFHLWRTGAMLEDIERAGPRIFGVHLNDARAGEHFNCLPGDGELPLVEIVRAIEATGYRGTYDNEYMVDSAKAESEPDEFGPKAVIERCTRAMTSVVGAALS